MSEAVIRSELRRTRRLLLLAILQALIPVLLFGGYIFYGSTAWVNMFNEHALTQRRSNLVRMVSMASHAIAPIVDEIKKGRVTKEEGIRQIRNLLRTMTFQDDYGPNYIFMVTEQGIGLVHPFEPEKEGQDRSQELDVKGNNITDGLLKAARSSPEGGFVSYYYYPPFSKTPQEKLTYALMIPEVNALISTGIYLDNFYQIQAQILDRMKPYFLGLIGLVLFSAVISIYQVNKNHHALLDEIRKRDSAQRQTWASEQNLRTVFDNIYNAIIIHDFQGKIIQANDQTLEMFGLTIKFLHEINIRDLSFHYDYRMDVIVEYWDKAKHGQEIIVEWKAINLKTRIPFFADVVIRKIQWYGEEVILAVILDVSERKRYERSILESEEKYRLLTENMQDVIWKLSADLVFTYVSPSDERWRGFNASEIVGKPLWNIIAPDCLDELKNQAASFRQVVMSYGELPRKTLETKLICKDGSTVWAEITPIPIFDKDGIFSGYQGISRDICERKHNEELIREREERLRSVMETTRDAIFLVDEDGLEIEWNPACVTLSGISREQAIGKKHWDLMWQMILPEKRTESRRIKLQKRIKEALQQGIPPRKERMEVDHVHLDGRRMTTLQSLFSIKTEKGYRLGGILHDITERKLSEIQLAESEERFRTIIEQLAEGLILVAEDGTILEWNAAFEGMVDVPRDRVLGRYIWDIQYANIPEQRRTPQKYEDLQNYVLGILTEGVGSSLDHPLRLDFLNLPGIGERNLEQVPFRIRTMHGYRLVIVVRDVTEQYQARKRIENELKKVQSLRRIDTCIIGQNPLSEILQVVAQQTRAVLQADGVKVLVLNGNKSTLSLIASEGISPAEIECPNFGESCGPAWRVVQAQKRQKFEVGVDDNILSTYYCLEKNSAMTYVGTPIITRDGIVGVMEAFLANSCEPDEDWSDFFETAAGQAAIAIEAHRLLETLEESNKQLSEAYEATIAGWSKALELRDEETKGHSNRVMDLASRLAERMGFEGEELAHFRRGVFLHDIGKMGIPDNILLKPGPLTEEEWRVMKMHPQFAYDLLAPIAYLRPALDVPYGHHERWNGSGYPRGLQGEEIPLAARIFAVVDVWDALISDRPYRLGWSIVDVKDYLRKNAAVLFDPWIVDEFLDMRDDG